MRRIPTLFRIRDEGMGSPDRRAGVTLSSNGCLGDDAGFHAPAINPKT